VAAHWHSSGADRQRPDPEDRLLFWGRSASQWRSHRVTCDRATCVGEHRGRGGESEREGRSGREADRDGPERQTETARGKTPRVQGGWQPQKVAVPCPAGSKLSKGAPPAPAPDLLVCLRCSSAPRSRGRREQLSSQARVCVCVRLMNDMCLTSESNSSRDSGGRVG